VPDVWEVMRAIRGSALPSTDRHILLTLVSLADPETAVIPERFTPSLSELAEMTGLGRSTVARRMNEVEAAGWVKRTAPSLEAAWRDKQKNRYALLIPVSTSPTTALVPEQDQSHSGTSATAGPVAVPERDRTSPATGHEVPDPRTTTTTTSSSSAKPRTPKPDEPEREDVEQVCTHLADWIARNGSKRPKITDRWRAAARLMLDNDGRTVEKVLKAIDWCQQDEFWRANILSMPTLREKYDQLRLAAQRTNSRASPAVNAPYRNPENQDDYDAWKART
jgi:DNA-binding Lrp family transcriptional regulator